MLISTGSGQPLAGTNWSKGSFCPRKYSHCFLTEDKPFLPELSQSLLPGIKYTGAPLLRIGWYWDCNTCFSIMLSPENESPRGKILFPRNSTVVWPEMIRDAASEITACCCLLIKPA